MNAKIGKHLFGRPARLSLGIYFASSDEASYLSEISERLGLPQSAVAQELANLVELRMLHRNDVVGSRRVYYTRLPSPWWSVFSAAARIMAATDTETSTRPLDSVQ